MKQNTNEIVQAIIYTTYAVCWFLGPVLMAAFLISGGNPLDGLFGVHTNMWWQDLLYVSGVLALLAGVLVSTVMSIVIAVRRFKISKKYLALVPASIVVPVLTFVLVFYISSLIKIYF